MAFKMNRREFFPYSIGFVGFLAALLGCGRDSKKDKDSDISEAAHLYNIYISSFSSNENASREISRLEGILDDSLKRNLVIREEDNQHKVVLQLNTIGDHANAIIGQLDKKNIAKGAWKKLEPFYYDPNANRGRYAHLIVEKSLRDTVMKYTTAFTPAEISATMQSLRIINANNNYLSSSNADPKRNDIILVPVRFLKPPYQVGAIKGRDYHEVVLKRGQTIWDISSTYTLGDIQNNNQILLDFNRIMKNQVRHLSFGTTILIPDQIYRNPYSPTVVKTQDGGFEIQKRERPSKPGEPPNAEIDKDIKDRVPDIGNIDYTAREKNLGVLRETSMPAVLLESFNIQNAQQLRFYSNDANLKALAEAYGQGILNHKQNYERGYSTQSPEFKRKHKPTLTDVIIDNGHGTKDPGAINLNDRRYNEGQFTIKIQEYLADFLKRNGLNVHKLNYDKEADQRTRVNWYVSKANQIAQQAKGESIYISTHIDSLNSNAIPAPRIFVHNDGKQVLSEKLASAMLSKAVPFYENKFT